MESGTTHPRSNCQGFEPMKFCHAERSRGTCSFPHPQLNLTGASRPQNDPSFEVSIPSWQTKPRRAGMERVKLGKSDLEVPVLCLGGNVYGWTLPEAESLRQLDAALEAGLNFIDTADAYSRWMPGHTGGESETILGKWLAKGNKHSNVILATKLGLEMGDGKKGLSAAYIEQAVEASLRRLQTDYIDLYQAHRDDPETLLEETLAAF